MNIKLNTTQVIGTYVHAEEETLRRGTSMFDSKENSCQLGQPDGPLAWQFSVGLFSLIN